MTGIPQPSPYMTCGPDFANDAGHISLPFSPTDRDDTSTAVWPDLCYGSTGLEHSNVFLPALPWQNAEWDPSQGFLKYPDASCNSPPAESVTSGSDSSLSAGMMIWDNQNDQLSQGREYSPSTTASSTSDHLMTVKPSSVQSFKQSSVNSFKPSPLNSSKEPSTFKKQTKTRKSPAEDDGIIAKRPRRTKTAEEKEACRARIREKNRVAADKCRGRQRVAVEKLSSRHGALEEENQQLSQILKDLVAERIVLKNMLLEHGGCGCELIENYLRDSAVRWVKQVESQSINVEAA